jgi:LacI family transcriptional regulator
MVQLKHIAERAGVSLMTASKALRDKPDVAPGTKAKIKHIADQMGYVPDRCGQYLRGRRTYLIGICAPTATDPTVTPTIAGIHEFVYGLAYDLMLTTTQNSAEREEAAINRMIGRQVEGLFIIPTYRLPPEAPAYRRLTESQIPTIVIGQTAQFCHGFVNVQGDDLAASQTVTRHLIALGHKRIAFLTGLLSEPWAEERLEGYRRGLREVGLDVDDRLVFHAGRTIEDGARAASEMIAACSDATAIQAVTDLVAIGCAEIFVQHGYTIPKDISITGFGNIQLSEHCRVPLTTICQPKYRLGVVAAQMMSQMLAGRRPQPQRLPADLLVRASSAPAPRRPPLATPQSRSAPQNTAQDPAPQPTRQHIHKTQSPS